MTTPGDERDPDGRPESGPSDGSSDDPEQSGGTHRSPQTGHSRPVPDDGRKQPGDTGGSGAPAREEWRSGEGHPGPPPADTTDDETSGWQVFAYDVVSSVLAVLVVGAYLYAVSGVWPPLVAVESGSMEPHMQVNDLVFVMEADRFSGPGAHEDTGVVTARTGQGVDYRKFGGYGDVIVYERDGRSNAVPIIHRAMFWVDEGENWYDKADADYVGGATECGETPEEGLTNCPAPHAGFITKGDDVGIYDQVSGLSRPVKPGWVVGTAELRVPGLGWIRLQSQAATANATRGESEITSQNWTSAVPG